MYYEESNLAFLIFFGEYLEKSVIKWHNILKTIFLCQGRICKSMLNIGMNLTLESLESNNPDKYKCKIADIENNNLYIDYPISLTTNRTAFLVNDLHLNCIFLQKIMELISFVQKL